MQPTNRITRRRFLKATGGGTAVTLLAGCADDEPAEMDWEAVDEFVFEGRVRAWTALEPDFIADEENPTIVLFEGQEYNFRWINMDGIIHNLEIRDGNDEVVDDYQSESVSEEGEEVPLDGVVATPEMTTYICQYHPTSQVGDIDVRSE